MTLVELLLLVLIVQSQRTIVALYAKEKPRG